MTINCGTITVWKPAHITATNMTIDPTECDELCDSTITITWTNTGGRTATITPGVIVDGVTMPAASPITLAKNQTATVIFLVTGLLEGDHSVCPVPN